MLSLHLVLAALTLILISVCFDERVRGAWADFILFATGVASGQANAMLDALARGTSYAGNSTVFVKLHTGDPGSAGTANAAGNTTRQQATFAAAASGANQSNADVNWTNVNTTETYSHVSYWTAASAGTFLGSAALTASKAVTAGDNFTIPSGSLTMSLTPLAA